MPYKFEKILLDNSINETDNTKLPKSIVTQITKFRTLEKKLKLNPESPEEIAANDKVELELEVLDLKIYNLIEDNFDIEDEEEEEKKKAIEALKKRAKAVGIDENATEAQIVVAEKQKVQDEEAANNKKSTLAKRAKVVGLGADASEAEIEKAEKLKAELSKRAKAIGLSEDATEAEIVKAEKGKAHVEETEAQKKTALSKRAKAVGLNADASESEIETAEEKKKLEDLEKDELEKPATSDRGALEKLFKKGKKTVTKADLEAAGFNTGFFGSVGPNGCTAGEYKIYRADPSMSTFELSKK